jgi:Fe2+ or Zn2+ uptake regulation protein
MAAHRNCPRQKAIRETIDALDGPFTAMQLWRKCRERRLAISRATVYREIRMLREEGYIKDIVLPHGLHVSARTDAEGCCITECEDCGRFRMCPAFVMEVADAAVNTPVIPSHAAVYLRGRCRERATFGKCKFRSEQDQPTTKAILAA